MEDIEKLLPYWFGLRWDQAQRASFVWRIVARESLDQAFEKMSELSGIVLAEEDPSIKLA